MTDAIVPASSVTVNNDGMEMNTGGDGLLCDYNKWRSYIGLYSCYDTKSMSSVHDTRDVGDEICLACNKSEITQWIHVNERLPKYETDVLAWNGRRIRVCYIARNHSLSLLDSHTNQVMTPRPTHWAKLPTTPGKTT